MAEVMRFGENRRERAENGCPTGPRSHELSAKTAQFCGLFGRTSGDGESRAGGALAEGEPPGTNSLRPWDNVCGPTDARCDDRYLIDLPATDPALGANLAPSLDLNLTFPCWRKG